MVGDGMVCLGVRAVLALTNLKLSTSIGRACRSFPVIANARGAKGLPSAPFCPSKPLAVSFTSTRPAARAPSSLSMKSAWKEVRRYSPSVMPSRPTDSCMRMTSRMQRSCSSLSAAGPYCPFSDFSCAARSSGARSRLPTWSARNGPIALAPARETEPDPGPGGRAVRRRVRHPLEIEMRRGARQHNPVADLRAAGLQPPGIEACEEVEVLALEGVDHQVVERLVDHEVRQTSRGKQADSQLPGIALDQLLQRLAEAHAALRERRIRRVVRVEEDRHDRQHARPVAFEV